MEHNKLIRDKIPDILNEKNIKSTTHIADDKEYYEKLKEKLLEETKEFLDDDNTEELADILEVIDAICKYKKIDKKDIENLKINKAEKRGSFNKRIILDKTE